MTKKTKVEKLAEAGQTAQKALAKIKSDLCLECLECCKWLVYPLPVRKDQPQDVVDRTKHFYETRGCETMLYKNRFLIKIFSPCQHLTPRGCAIYDDRPLLCKNYDGRDSPISKDDCLWLVLGESE
jgi:Fe-S-cluster containining protein